MEGEGANVNDPLVAAVQWTTTNNLWSNDRSSTDSDSTTNKMSEKRYPDESQKPRPKRPSQNVPARAAPPVTRKLDRAKKSAKGRPVVASIFCMLDSP